MGVPTDSTGGAATGAARCGAGACGVSGAGPPRRPGAKGKGGGYGVGRGVAAVGRQAGKARGAEDRKDNLRE